MTLKTIIELADSLKPNTFNNTVKTRWINELEGTVQIEILGINHRDIVQYDYDADKDRELIVDPPHDKIYPTYLMAMIDFANTEYAEYQNTMALFNTYYSDFAKWFQRACHPEGININDEGFYISAYGLAVKHGFAGTEEEWLASLKGEKGDQGIQGPIGPQGVPGVSMTIGTTTTGAAGTDALVTNTGTDSDPILNFTIPQGIQGIQGETGERGPQGIQGEQGPQGIQGIQGDAATITVGTVTTGEPGTPASVTNVGTSGAAIFNFTIPKGAKGDAGAGSGDMLASDYDPASAVKDAGGIVSYVDGKLEDYATSSYVDEADVDLQSQIDAITSRSDVVDVVNVYDRGADTSITDVAHYDTTDLGENDVIKVMQDETHSNAISYYRWSNNAWSYVGSQGPFYTKSETDTLLNAKATPSDISSAVSTHNSNASAHSDIRTAISNVLPSQSGQSGKYLKTNGSVLSWADASVGLSVTLAVAGWTSSGDVYTQTLSVQGVTSSNNVLVAPSPANFSAYGEAGIYCSAQSTNSLTFTATALPSSALAINVVILG